MKVLVTSMPGPGHVHPVVPIADALKRSGHDVRWVIARDGVDRVERYGFRAIPISPRSAAPPPAPADLSGVPPRERRARIFGERFGAGARWMRPALGAIADEFRPDLALHDIAALAVPAVASARGIPKATVAFSGPLSHRLLQGVLEGVADVWRDEGVEIPPDAGLYDGIYLHRFPRLLGPRPQAAGVRDVRPVVFDGGGSSQPPAWLAALGTERPAVYVTLGTVVTSVAQWAALFGALGTLDLDVVATTGMQLDPRDIGPAPSNVRVERYVPQSFLLDRVVAVISHAGAGTLVAAAGRGLPQICIPMGADMWENADALSGAGAGITLEETDRDEEAICLAVDRVLGDPSFGAAARSVADEIANLPHPDSLVPTLEQLAASR